MGYVYLIQPAEFRGTNVFKVGASDNDSLHRVKNYRRGTRVISIEHAENPFEIEKKIITNFRCEFNLHSGREYFEGNEQEIHNLFYVLRHLPRHD